MNWRKNAVGFLFGTLLLVGCNTTQIPEPKAEPKPSEPLVGINNPKEMPHWFWNPSWWLTDGPIVQEVKDTIAQNPWILSTSRRLNVQSNGGSNLDAFNLDAAEQHWDGNSGLLTVSMPMGSGTNPAFVYMAIRPTYYVFGPHQWGIERVAYDHIRRVKILQPNLPPQSVSDPNAGVLPDQFGVNTFVPINPGGSLGKASATWYNLTQKKVIQDFQTIHAASDDDVNTFINGKVGIAAIQKCYAPPPVSSSSIVVTPVCPPPNACPPGAYLQSANIIATLCAPPPPPAGPDCKKLKQAVDDARGNENGSAVKNVLAFSGFVANCAPLVTGPKGWINGLKCVTAIGVYAVSLSDVINSTEKRRNAESEYADNCAKP